MSITKLDAAGFTLLKEFEGLILHPYIDQAHIPTIGYGSTYYENGNHVTMQDPPITAERAMELFNNTSTQYANAVHYWTKPVLTQNRFNALFCLVYNIGTNGFKGSTVLRLINSGIMSGDQLKVAWLSWDKAKGMVISDLLARRKKEYAVFIS